MIYKLNSAMKNETEKEPKLDQQPKKPQPKPNERAGFVVMGHVKIFDPETQQVFVETRA